MILGTILFRNSCYHAEAKAQIVQYRTITSGRDGERADGNPNFKTKLGILEEGLNKITNYGVISPADKESEVSS
jgi:hypothetical protein